MRSPRSIARISSPTYRVSGPARSTEQVVDLGLAVAHHQIPVDAAVALGARPVERHQPVDRALEVVGVEAVEGHGTHRGLGEHLAGQAEHQRPVPGLGECVRDGQVRDGGREEHGAVGLLGPQVAGDVVRRLGPGQRLGQFADPVAHAAAGLPDAERRDVAVEHHAGLEVVGSEVDESGDDAVGAHLGGDRVGRQAVLQREHVAVGGQPIAQQGGGRRGVVRLHRDDRPPDDRRQLLGADGGRLDGELLDRPGDAQSGGVDGGHVSGVGVAQEDVVAGPDQVRGNGAADRSGADDGEVHGSRANTAAERPASLGAQTSLFNIEEIYECHTRPYGARTHLGAARRPTLRRPHVIIAALSVAALSLAACGGSDSGGSNASGGGGTTKGGDLVLVRPSDSTDMNNTMVFDNDSIWVFQQMLESLYQVTEDGTDVEPLLVEKDELSDDQKTLTITLKDGITFSNGDEMTSEDVKFSLDKARSTKGGWEFLDVAIDSVEAPDPKTVVITTKYPWAPLKADLANFNNAILPKDYAGKSSEEFYKAPIGTGPFKWDHWDRGSELKLVKNKDYWDGEPSLDSVTWKVVGDDNARALQLQGGQAQINQSPPYSTLDQLKAQQGIKVELFPSTKTDYIMMNENEKPYDDVHVRRAISYAIDREAIVKTVLFGNGTVGNSLLMPTVPYYDKEAGGPAVRHGQGQGGDGEVLGAATASRPRSSPPAATWTTPASRRSCRPRSRSWASR